MNVSPSAVDDAVVVAEDDSEIINVLGNDTDGDGDSLELLEVTEPQNGTVEIVSESSVRYTPNSDFNGSDQFNYQVSDGTVEVIASVSVTITPVNDIPDAVDDNILLPPKIQQLLLMCSTTISTLTTIHCKVPMYLSLRTVQSQ